jgi:hypothetical protein
MRAALPVLCAAFILQASVGLTASSAGSNPAGSWRAVGQCFLSQFALTENGGAALSYRNGEADPDARWSWQDGRLVILSAIFDKDSFSGRYEGARITADYTWHNGDTNTLNPGTCTFERFDSNAPGV